MSERKQRKHINNHQVTAGEAQPEKCASLFRDIPKCTDTDPSRDRWASISCVVPPSRWQDGERESLSGTAHRVGHYWDEPVFWLVRSQTLSLSLSRYNGPNVRALRMPKYNQVMLSGWPLRADDRAPEIYCSVLMMHNAHSPISTVNREIGVRSTGTLLNTCWSTILPTVPDWPVHCRRRRVAIRGTISRCGNLRRWPRLRCTAPTLLGRPSPTGPPAPSAHFPPVPTLPLQTKKKKTKKKIWWEMWRRHLNKRPL